MDFNLFVFLNYFGMALLLCEAMQVCILKMDDNCMGLCDCFLFWWNFFLSFVIYWGKQSPAVVIGTASFALNFYFVLFF